MKAIVSKEGMSKYMVQPGNREWAFPIEYVSEDGFVVPTYMTSEGKGILPKCFPDPQATIRVSDKG